MKRKRRRRKKTNRRPLLWLFLLLLILSGAGYYYFFVYEGSLPLPYKERFTTVSDPLILNDKPLIQTLYQWHKRENLDRDDINRRLPDPFKVLIAHEDINGNSFPNYLVVTQKHFLPEPDTFLKQAGYREAFMQLLVYEIQHNTPRILLHVNKESMVDERNNRLIDQVPADNGYALIYDNINNDLYPDLTGRFLEVIMMTETGGPGSDDIILYWDREETAYKATNIFGMP